MQSLAVLERLLATTHSLALSHYWLTRGLLAAGFPPWPGAPLLSQPEPLQLPGEAHVDASLSADAGSTWTSDHQVSPPQAIQLNLPPSRWITRACQCSRREFTDSNSEHTIIVNCFLLPAQQRKRKSFTTILALVLNNVDSIHYMNVPTLCIMFWSFLTSLWVFFLQIRIFYKHFTLIYTHFHDSSERKLGPVLTSITFD